MTLREAQRIVTELAMDNLADYYENQEEYEIQSKALDIINDFFASIGLGFIKGLDAKTLDSEYKIKD